MGVKGLQYYIEQHCPEACKYVSIEKLAFDYKTRYKCQPVLVVDGMALIYPLYSTSLEWIYGGQWMQFLGKLENFIKRFDEIGVKLVFFFDGTVSSIKRKEWVRRRIGKYKQIASLFSCIKNDGREPDKSLFQLPTSMGTMTRFALKELGAEVYQTDREADEVIAEYAANRNDVFAILSQDTDFIIYNTKPYLSISHFDLNTLQTVYYDRDCFAFRYLHLYLNQLPLFAVLAGNDIVSAERLRHFHQSLCQKRGRVTIDNIASNLVKLINSEHWTGDFNNKDELNRISSIVFGDRSYSWLIRDGLRSYAIGFKNHPPKLFIQFHPELERTIYERHIHCINGPFIFNLLSNMEYESSEVLEDSSWIPSALTYRRIRQRCYGILFNCFFNSQNHRNETSSENDRNIIIKEWCAYEGNLMERAEPVEPLPLDYFDFLECKEKIPSIENLWFRSTENERLKLFWMILQAPLEYELLYKIPKHLISLCCILNYLIGTDEANHRIQPWEIAVFIVQALWKRDALQLKNLVVPWVDATAVHLATLFMRGVTTVLMVLGTCGYPFDITYAMPWHFFDGKLFHYLYVTSKEKPNLSRLCGNQEDLITEFYSLLPVVTSNTAYAVDRLNWKNILEDFKQ